MGWNIFASLFSNRQQNQIALTGRTSPLLNIPEDTMLDLQSCQDIYTFWGLGKRLVHALPRFALSSPREIVIQEAPPEVAEEFVKAAIKLKQDDIVSRGTVYCRIYGMGGIFTAYTKSKIATPEKSEAMSLKEQQEFLKQKMKQEAADRDKVAIANLTIKDVQSGKITFNALNPLNLSGTVFSQDALSTEYQKPITIVVAGQTVGSRRATVIQNNDPIYLRWTTSTFNFSGISIFQNMIRLIKAWHRAIISFERMATKGSSIVFKDGVRGRMSGIMATAAKSALQRMRDMENDGAVSIDKDGDVAFFNLTGVAEVDTILKGLEREITMALDDTPLAILLDKSLSSGLSEGTEDLKAVIMAVNNFRKDFLTPLYALTDPYVQAVAWTDEFILKIIKKHPEIYAGGFTIQEIRQLWQESFSYEWGNLYPPTEKETQETNKIVLENIKIVSDMGGEAADIEAEIKERKLFLNDITINPPPEPESGFGEGAEGGKEGEEETDAGTSEK